MSLVLPTQSLHLGIDPGLSGAIVGLLHNLNVKLLRKTPVFKVARNNTRYDLREMLSTLRSLRGDYLQVHCCIEKSHSRPTDSRPSAWTNGCGFGFWQMALTAVDIPYTIVPPKVWQEHAFTSANVDRTGKNSKQLSIECAKVLLPGINLLPTPRSRKDDHNISDAALLALYCVNESRS